MHHLTDKLVHTMAIIIPVQEHWLEQEIAQLDHKGLIRSMNIKIRIKNHKNKKAPHCFILFIYQILVILTYSIIVNWVINQLTTQ